MAHTPGPWHHSGGGEVVTTVGLRPVICRMAWYHKKGSRAGEAHQSMVVPYPQQEANAVLIAAAPDLLDACTLALAWCPNAEIGGVLQTAIAKATRNPA